jgi:hypothetical protein
MVQLLQLKLFILMDGVDFDDVRDYANKQLVLNGFKEPDTDEEKAMLEAQAQTAAEPDAMTLAAMAEMEKANALKAEQQRKVVEMQLDAQKDQGDLQIDAFEAQTDRLEVLGKIEESKAKVNNTNVETFGKQLENTVKAVSISDISKMSNEMILQQIAQGQNGRK